MFPLSSFKIKTILVLLLLVVAMGSFFYTQYLVEKIREKERTSVELWAKAMEYQNEPHYQSTRNDISSMMLQIQNHSLLQQSQKEQWVQILRRAESDLANASMDFVVSELIIEDRFNIPAIVVDDDREIIQDRNVDEDDLNPELISEYGSINQPISIVFGSEEAQQQQLVYYGDSALITNLQYFPYVQFGLLTIFLGLGYLSLSSIKRNEQSNLWVGMAKEAAHQLGTPLSSIYGWMALLKEQFRSDEELKIIHELNKDVERIQFIAERFNKIGSAPELKPKRVIPLLDDVMDYLDRRIPKHGKNITLKRTFHDDEKLNINPELFSWAIENLVKNAADAIKNNNGTGEVSVTAMVNGKDYIIDVTDSGRGIEKKYQREIFNPGFSTKKRGWGLGLSLTKRIIEEYHGGKVSVLKSEVGKGTTFRIKVPIAVKPNQNHSST